MRQVAVWGKSGGCVGCPPECGERRKVLENPGNPSPAPDRHFPRKLPKTPSSPNSCLTEDPRQFGQVVVLWRHFRPRSFARATTVKASLIAATVPSAGRGCNQLCMQVTVPPGDRSWHATSTSGPGNDMEVGKVGARCLLGRDFPNSEKG